MASTNTIARTVGIWDCSICFESLTGEKEKQVVSICTHIFHKSCIAKWLQNHTTCPLCVMSWQVALEVDANDTVELFTATLKHATEERKACEKRLAELELELAPLKKQLEQNQSIRKQKKPLVISLNQLSDKQLRQLAKKLEDMSLLKANLETFVRHLYSEMGLYSKEATELWNRFRKKKYNEDLIYQILSTFAREHSTSFDDLKRSCMRCGIAYSEASRMIEEIIK